MRYISKSENETTEIANAIAQKAKGGDIFALSGDLGSGKTTFVKGFAKALGITQNITSPTFVISKIYKGQNINLLHVDCYRLESADDADAIGLPEFFQRNDFVTVAEWPEKIEGVFPAKTQFIKFNYLSAEEREIIIE